MGWKSTINITRKEAIQAIMAAIDKTPYDDLSNTELEDILYSMGFGDDFDKPYYGYNFIVSDKIEKEE